MFEEKKNTIERMFEWSGGVAVIAVVVVTIIIIANKRKIWHTHNATKN